jgi:hypothetical protein
MAEEHQLLANALQHLNKLVTATDHRRHLLFLPCIAAA